jgi:hypothetical protein
VIPTITIVAGCSTEPVARQPSPVPAASVAPGELDPGGLTWLALQSVEEEDLLVGLELALVRGDGSVAWRDRVSVDTQAPAAGIGVLAGPARTGRIAVGTHVAGGTRILIVDVSGATRTLVVSGSVLSGVLAPDGSELYLVVSGPELTIERLDLDGDGTQSTLAPMPPIRQPELNSGIDLLWVTPDGRRLVTEVCTDFGSCWWQIIDLESAETMELHPDGAGQITDLSNDTLLAAAADCDVGPCPFVLVDLDSGAVRPWDPGAHNAALAIAEDGSTILLTDGGGLGAGSGPITAIDPTSMEERVLHARDPDAALGLARAGQGEWAPPGWVVAAPPGLNVGEGGGPTLIRLKDGFVLRLPAPAGS